MDLFLSGRRSETVSVKIAIEKKNKKKGANEMYACLFEKSRDKKSNKRG